MEDGRPARRLLTSPIQVLLLWGLCRLDRRRALHPAKRTGRARRIVRARRIRLYRRSRYLQRGLGRRRDQAGAAIHGWIVDKLPIVVMILVIEFANALFLARAGHTHNRAPAEDLAG